MYFKNQNHSKEDSMKIKYAKYLILNMGLGDTTTCAYQFIFDENDSN